MENVKRINYINEYLKEKFGERTLKIGIDGGFTCPNRDGKKGIGGCIFCSERGSGEHLKGQTSIEEQVENYFSSYKSKRANSFIIYFQNFSNTYDGLESLKTKYDTALETAERVIDELGLDKKIVGLSIATRPDCINEAVCKLLSTYTNKYEVTVELGIQTSNDETGKLINRCYTSRDFTDAVCLLNKYEIDVVAHMMVGLPEESHEDIVNTVNFLNGHYIQGVKIHSTYIVENTELKKLYDNKKYSPITLEEYLKEVIYIITHLNPDFVVHRISGDAPKDILVAPEWNHHKKLVLNGVFNTLKKDNLWQGMYF